MISSTPRHCWKSGGVGGAHQGDAAAGVLGAAGGEAQRHLAFGRLVDDHQEFAGRARLWRALLMAAQAY